MLEKVNNSFIEDDECCENRCSCCINVLEDVDERWTYVYFVFTVVMQLCFLLAVMQSSIRSLVDGENLDILIISTFLQIMQLFATLFAVLTLLAQVKRLHAYSTWGVYLFTIVGFSGVYYSLALCSLTICTHLHSDKFCHDKKNFMDGEVFAFSEIWLDDHSSKYHQGLLSLKDQNPYIVYVKFLYFSMTTQSSVGFGDIVPTSVTARFFANAQMFIGLFFGSIIVSMNLSTLRRAVARARREQSSSLYQSLSNPMDEIENKSLGRTLHIRNSEDNPDVTSRSALSPQRHRGYDSLSEMRQYSTSVGKKNGLCGKFRRCFKHVTRLKWVTKVRRFIRKWLLFVSVALQALHLLALYHYDPNLFFFNSKDSSSGNVQTSAFALSLFIQVLHLSMVVSTSLKYVRHSENITINFLVQSFMSVCVLFAGIYIMVYLFQKQEAWPLREGIKDNAGFWYMSGEFLYLSITTMTTTGYGDLSPRSSFAILMVSLQIIASAMFYQIIIALGVNMMTEQMGVGDDMYFESEDEMRSRYSSAEELRKTSGAEKLEEDKK